MHLPPHSTLHPPATEEALASLYTLLGPHAAHLLPLYQLTDGLEIPLPHHGLHLQLSPIASFTPSHREHHLIIGSDTHSADLILNTHPAITTPTIELWCGFGGGKITTLSPLPDFLHWLLDRSP